MFQTFKRIVRVMSLVLVTNVMLGQTKQLTPLPKGANLEAIIYYKTNMIAVGYVYKNQFVENQQITFLKPKGFNNLAGYYYITEKDGLFYLQNRYDNSKNISVSSCDTIVCGVYFSKNDTSYINGKFMPHEVFNKSKYEGIFQISNTDKGTNLTTNPEESFYPLTTIRYTSRFKIKIIEPIYYQTETNEKYRIYERKLKNNIITVKIEFPSESNIQTIEFQTSKIIEIDEINNSFFKQIEEASILYRNNDNFSGSIKYDDDSNKFIPQKGEYKYASGEMFTGVYGNIYLNGRIFVPYDGKTVFTDGSVVEGDWLKHYDFTYDEWEQIYKNSNSLTEIRDNAVRANTEQQQKLQAEKIAKQEANEKKKIAEQKRKQIYINKYGEYYGTLISKGQLDVGMTQAMVNEVWKKDFFIISKSIRNGKIIEIWEFSKDKMQMAVLSEGAKNKENGGGEAALAAIYLMGLSEQLGGPNAPQMLVFKNNKLTDIYR